MIETIKFELRFATSDIREIAGRYNVKKWKDDEVERIGRVARKRGYFTKEEFLRVSRWKCPRTNARCRKNRPDFVTAVTETALKTENEQLRIEALTLLCGVEWPTASVLLHFGHPERYPILDFRALESLGKKPPTTGYTFDFWWDYVLYCRDIAEQAGVGMRTLDRALWQYSKENP